MELKSKIFKLLVNRDGEVKDYAVQAYNLEDGITALAKKLKVNRSQISLSSKGYSRKELEETHFANPFIRERDTISDEDLKMKRIIEKAQADLNALLRYERPKTISDGCMFVIKDIDGRKTMTNEIRFRPFHTTSGTHDDGVPMLVSNNKDYPRTGVNRPFKTDTNDIIFDDPDTILLPNTDYIFPVSVGGNKDARSLESVFRFSSEKEAYEFVRQQIIDAGIANVDYRFNKSMTYLEACDSWLCGTNIKMGNKEARQEVIDKYNEDMSKVKENGKLKYPKLKSKLKK